jgi:hypothetical protein
MAKCEVSSRDRSQAEGDHRGQTWVSCFRTAPAPPFSLKGKFRLRAYCRDPHNVMRCVLHSSPWHEVCSFLEFVLGSILSNRLEGDIPERAEGRPESTMPKRRPSLAQRFSRAFEQSLPRHPPGLGSREE